MSYLCWFRSWKPPKDLPEAMLVDILHMSKMWLIEDGVKLAQHWLKQSKISTTKRLQLAKHYEIWDWVTPAIQELLKTPLGNLSNVDLDHINIRLYSIIAKAKEALENQRKLIAACPPSLPKDSPGFQTVWCTSHATCAKVWADTWWKVVVRMDSPFSQASGS